MLFLNALPEYEKYYLRMDLQLFGEGGDKTEEPTSKKLEDTRKQGQVGKSQELVYGISLLALFLIIRIFAGGVGERFINVFKWVYGTLIGDIIATERQGLTVKYISDLMTEIIKQLGLTVLPFFAIGFLVAALGMGLQFKFKVSYEPLKPKFDKLNPASGIKRIFSAQSLFNLGLSIVKLTVVFVIAYITIRDHLMELFLLYELDIKNALLLVADIIINTGIRISVVYLLVGIIDLIYQKWKFKSQIKMTKQEVKDEYKDAEGDPQVKGQIKQRMREASQRRMMQSVPQADVVITNPTHLACALKYDSEVANAPILVAKGEQFVAERIKETARQAGVPVIENKGLARALFATVDVGEQIPAELYIAVAEILALVFTQRER